MKTCCVCKGQFANAHEAFHKNSSRKDGLSETCRECAKQRSREYYHAHKHLGRSYTPEQLENNRRRAREWRKNNYARAVEVDRKKREVRAEFYRNYDKQRQQTPERKVAKANYKRARRARLAGALSTLTKAQWEAILEMFSNRCAYCGVGAAKLEQDHVLPLARGGAHTTENVVPACRSCNAQKNTKTPEEWCN